MNWTELAQIVIEVCLIPLLFALGNYFIKWLNAKRQEIIENSDNALTKKYTALLTDTIASCVICTNQTYVNALKEEGKFDADAQKVAFEKTFKAVLSILSEEAKTYLTEIYGDLTVYISNKIEAEVLYNKI